MRLAWIDAGMAGTRLRDMTVENAKQIHNIGIRIVGVPNELDAADKDIEWAKRFLADNDLIRLHLRNLLQADLVITEDPHIHPQLAQVLDQVVGEGIVVVDNEDHGSGLGSKFGMTSQE